MNRSTRGIAICGGLIIGLTGSLVALAEEPSGRDISPDALEFFEKQVRPLLVKRCFDCHGGTKAAGGLSLATANAWRKGGDSGPAIIPGQPDKSLLIEAVNYRSLEMPPPEKGGKLPENEIAILAQWVAMGAPDPRDGRDTIGGMSRETAQSWWAFQPLPDADATQGSPHLDALIERDWASRGLTPAPLADRRTLIRRATYDLTGLPPTPAEVDAFLADDSPEAFARLVDRLLDSPQYGVQWGRHWLDVVRYADTAGENTDRPLPHAWRYRNWVFDAFRRDLPFDQFVRMQLAGDLIVKDQSGPARADGIIATGYLAIARRFGHDIDKDMYLTHEDVIDNIGKNFLGLSLGCARCHEHKYDPVTSEDYYALYGIFESTRFAFPGCEPKGQPRDLVSLLSPAETEALLQPWQAKVAQAEAEKQRRRQAVQAATESIHPLWTASRRTLSESNVGEGASVPFEHRLTVRRGETVQLAVSPNGNHGADSTLVEWNIREVGGESRRWSVSDLVPDLLQGNPHPAPHGASWCFVDATDFPAFLTEQRRNISGVSALSAWALGSEPSVFVNSSGEPVQVWTRLPAESFFVHPGINRPVGVAWISPLDGEVEISGRVADAHPSGGDGVAFRLEHLAAPEIGPALAEIGRSVVDLPDPGPAPTIPVAYAVIDAMPKNARFQQRGDPEKLGDEVPRRWLSIFGGDSVAGETESGRRELGDRIADHPLTARVMVNRIWEWHFGRGLVRTSNDFGARGEPPTHPELLDWLAAKFRESNYSMKAMHRLIMNSATYQRASGLPQAEDPENRWLTHFSRRRLTAEELRDSLLATSGRLDLTPGEAHPFPAESTWTFTQHAPFNAVYETNRRSAYLMVQRQRRHPFLALFDGADPNASTPARQTTTVPTQALYFVNDPFFHAQAAAFADSLMSSTDDDARTERVFRILLQRTPTPSEKDRVRRFLSGYPGTPVEKWAALSRVLMASNEFVHVE